MTAVQRAWPQADTAMFDADMLAKWVAEKCVRDNAGSAAPEMDCADHVHDQEAGLPDQEVVVQADIVSDSLGQQAASAGDSPVRMASWTVLAEKGSIALDEFAIGAADASGQPSFKPGQYTLVFESEGVRSACLPLSVIEAKPVKKK